MVPTLILIYLSSCWAVQDNLSHSIYSPGTYRRLTKGVTIIRIAESLKRDPKFNESVFSGVNLMWQVFWYCMTNYDFSTDLSPCTEEFAVYKGDGLYLPVLNWRPSMVEAVGPVLMMALFNLALCQNYEDQIPFVCPNPCLGKRLKHDQYFEGFYAKGNPCDGVSNTKSSRCLRAPSIGKYIHQLFHLMLTSDNTPSDNRFLKTIERFDRPWGFSCDCSDGYSWNLISQTCEKSTEWKDLCPSVEGSGCHPLGTDQCTVEQKTGVSECICRPGFHGLKCNLLLNACNTSLVSYTVVDEETGSDIVITANGMELCNVNMSGLSLEWVSSSDLTAHRGEHAPPTNSKNASVTPHNISICLPLLGTTIYQCRCAHPFVEDRKISVPNCLRRRRACDRRLCLFGTCVDSISDAETSFCVCKPGFDGEMCERKVEDWGVWSECLPECGKSRRRSRRRTIVTLNSATWEFHNEKNDKILDGPNTVKQVEICPPRTGSQCPLKSNARKNSITTDPSVTELQAMINLAITFGIIMVYFSAGITFLIRRTV